MADTAHTPSLLEGIAAVISASAWPLVTSIFLFAYRREVRNILSVLVDKLRKAKHIKAAGLEIEELIDEALRQAPASSPEEILADSPKVPEDQVESAKRLHEEVLVSGVDRSEAVVTARDRVRSLALRYEEVRRTMPRGTDRTYEMNRVMASMRTLALLAKPFLRSLAISSLSGERLAAIAVLQVEPDPAYSRWLCERFSNESPFVFFQAAVALQELVRKRSDFDRAVLKADLETAFETLQSYTGGEPDQNSVDVLRETIRELAWK